jgi:hypothetical protein
MVSDDKTYLRYLAYQALCDQHGFRAMPYVVYKLPFELNLR